MICANCRTEISSDANFCSFCGARQHAAETGAPRASKRLMRSSVDVKIGGVCGGVAEYLEMDSTVVRLIWVLASLLPPVTIPGVVGYLAAWIIMPRAPLHAAAPSAVHSPQTA